jgi:hypothetical protein
VQARLIQHEPCHKININKINQLNNTHRKNTGLIAGISADVSNQLRKSGQQPRSPLCSAF